MAEKESGREWDVMESRIFRMVSVGVLDDPINSAYDVISIGALVANLACAILSTFSSLAAYEWLFNAVEAVTVAFFAVDYILRLLTANCLYPSLRRGPSILRYIFSGAGIIDLLSFLPYYLPVFFPAGVVAFRMFRVARILRLFRINAYYDSLNVITDVLYSKKQQLLSSVFIILVLMLGASLCMYSLEHDAQPDVFSNAFSGIWWAASTLLTVGYGDIYPVTTLGKFFGIVITFLGVGMVAIPTGIISAGFVEQYQQVKKIGDYAFEEQIRFIRLPLKKRDAWTGRKLKDIGLPSGAIVAAVHRGKELIIPSGDVTFQAGDILTVASKTSGGEAVFGLKEMILRKHHPWNGCAIADLDFSRQTYIVLVERKGTMLIPRGDLVLQTEDRLYLLTKEHHAAQ